MGYALLSTAKSWISSGFATDHDERLTEAVNAIRRELYAWYSEVNLFVDAEECFELQRFCLNCNSAQDFYYGVTLPREYAAVEAMWYDNRPVQLFDRWRQWQVGIAPQCDCELMKFDMGDDYPTERDISPTHPERIRVMAMSHEDIGKRLILRGMSITGPAEIEFCLSDKPQLTELPFRSIARHGISKDITEDRVVISAQSGRILSIYAKEETVPAYKRIKITGVPDSCAYVNIRAARNYIELFDGRDVVETDNQRAWEAMGRYLRINRKQDRTGDDMRSEAGYVAQAKSLLLGDKSRAAGKSAQGQVVFTTPNFQKYSLRGRRGFRR